MKRYGVAAFVAALAVGTGWPGRTAQAQSLVTPGWSLALVERPFPPGCPPPEWEWYPTQPFGWSLAGLGDLDGDGRPELAAGDSTDGLVGFWILTPNGDGSFATAQFVGGWCEPFTNAHTTSSSFGTAIAPLGDLDGDGRPELVVTSPATSSTLDALYLVTIGPDLRPASYVLIDAEAPGMAEPAAHAGRFGQSVAALGDLDGDGLPEIAVGAPRTSLTGPGGDAVWILSLAGDDVLVRSRIDADHGPLAGLLEPDAWFGFSLAALGDVDGDGVTDLAVGAPRAGETTIDASFVTHDPGEVWILLLQPDGSVKQHARLGPGTPGPQGGIDSTGHFGASLCALGDRDGDGFPEIAVGNRSFPDTWAIDGWYEMEGFVWILGVGPDGSLSSQRRLSNELVEPVPTFLGVLGDQVAFVGDTDGDGVDELAVVSLVHGDKDIGIIRRPWLVRLPDSEVSPPVLVTGERRHGSAAVALPDRDGDGVEDLAVGARWDFTHGNRKGSVTIQYLDGHGLVKGSTVIDAQTLAPFTTLQTTDELGTALATADLDGDGVLELLAGAAGATGAADRGALFVLGLGPDDEIVSFARIDDTHPALQGRLADGDRFGSAVAVLPDLDGNGFPELAVGAPQADRGGADRGAVFVLFLGEGAEVLSAAEISATAGGFAGPLDDGDAFGCALAALGDLAGDGPPVLAVGASGDDDGGSGRGAVWLLRLLPDGSVMSAGKISATSGRFVGPLADSDQFGISLALLPDLDGDGRRELAVGAQRDDDGAFNAGAVWLLFLDASLAVRAEHKLSAATEPALAGLDEGGLFGSSLAGRPASGHGPELFAGIEAHDTLAHLSLRTSTWESAGPGTPGIAGVPRLSGTGLLLPGSPVALEVARAAPLQPVVLIAGASALHVPFGGGVLVPAPDVLLPAGTTDASGGLHVQQKWPPGVEPDTTVFVQAWIADASTPSGLSASNGLAATAP